MAVASTSTSGQIIDWQELDVGWDSLHDEGTEGDHHARVARFLIDHHVDVVVAEHMGPGMTRVQPPWGSASRPEPSARRAAVLTAHQQSA